MRKLFPAPSRFLLSLAAGACTAALVIASACTDDDGDVTTPSGGAGGTNTGGENVGGFGLSQAGGSGGIGGNEGGTTAAPAPTWDEVYGGATVADAVFPQAIAVDSAGNVIVVGSFQGTVVLGGTPLAAIGNTDLFYAKYSATGTHVWSFRAGDAEDQAATSVAVDSDDNIWIGGTIRGTAAIGVGAPTLDASGAQFPDSFIAKLGPDAAHIYSEAHGENIGGSEYGRAIATSPGDDAVLVGMFQLDVDFGGMPLNAADYTMFVARYNNAGTPAVTLATQFGATGVNDALAVAVGVDSTIAMGGFTEGPIDFGGGALTPTNGEQAVLGVITSAGAQVYSKIFTSDGDAAAVTGLDLHSNGDLVATGFFSQTLDLGGNNLEAMGAAKEIFFARFDNIGTLLEGRRFGGTGADEPAGIALDSEGFAAVAGRFTGNFDVNSQTSLEFGASANDAFIMRLAPDGHGYWGYNLGAAQDAQAFAVAVGPDDTIHVVGKFTGEINMGNGTKGGSLTQGMFLAKYPAE